MQKANLTILPFASNSMNGDLAALVLHEVSLLKQALQEIKRVLKVDGTFVLVEYDHTNEKTAVPPQHTRLSAQNLSQQLTVLGFAQIQQINFANELYILTAKNCKWLARC